MTTTAVPRVAIIMSSSSDQAAMEEAAVTLDRFGILHELRGLSAHTTPHEASSYAATAAERGLEVIIAAAGDAAHLAGTVAAKTHLPVIGVPLSGSLDGIDALLATVQVPAGAPVATVAVDGAVNAALLAVAILALSDPVLAAALTDHRRELAATTRGG